MSQDSKEPADAMSQDSMELADAMSQDPMEPADAVSQDPSGSDDAMTQDQDPSPRQKMAVSQYLTALPESLAYLLPKGDLVLSPPMPTYREPPVEETSGNEKEGSARVQTEPIPRLSTEGADGETTFQEKDDTNGDTRDPGFHTLSRRDKMEGNIEKGRTRVVSPELSCAVCQKVIPKARKPGVDDRQKSSPPKCKDCRPKSPKKKLKT